MQRIKIENKWAKCGNCGHKLFKLTGSNDPVGIEIKCHSCKEINTTDQTWYFTFGYGQKNAGHFVKFSGTYSEARDKMFDAFGTEWAFQYSEEEWMESISREVCTEIELTSP